jgi:tRNA(adenine34) deaminase
MPQEATPKCPAPFQAPSNEFLEDLMAIALGEARLAAQAGEVPIGAVLAVDDQIIAKARNQVEEAHDPTAHAEILVLQAAAKTLGNWRLERAVLVVTVEPCTMCLGALRLARVPLLVLAAPGPRFGAVGSLYDLSLDDRLGPPLEVVRGVCERESQELMQDFFRKLRES